MKTLITTLSTYCSTKGIFIPTKKCLFFLSFILTLFILFSCAPEDQELGAQAYYGEDPLLPYAWHLKNTGDISTFSSNTGTKGESIKALDVHDLGFTGEGVKIAVSDDGLEIAHEDLENNMLDGEHRNYALEGPPYTGNPTPQYRNRGHGTSVSGIIASVAHNGVGSRGVAYGAKIAGFSYLYSQNSAATIDQANGPFDIFNYSYGYTYCFFRFLNSNYIGQLQYGVNNLRESKGAIYVKAAGNDYHQSINQCIEGSTATQPYWGNANLDPSHTYPYMIVVGALNAQGVKSSYSVPGSSLWISAPGGEYGTTNPAIITTDLTGCHRGYSNYQNRYNAFEYGHPLNYRCNYTSIFNGTSSATPMVSGSVAVLLDANPNLTWRDVKYILAKTARKVDPQKGDSSHPSPNRDLSGHVYMQGWITNNANFNFHNWYGFGAIDLDRAVQLAQNYTPPWSSSDNFQESQWTSRTKLALSIPDQSATGVSDSVAVGTNFTIEAVQIHVKITHPYVGDLGIELTSPENTKSILMHINSNILEVNINNLLSSNAFYMEGSRGNWTLKVIDGGKGDTGTLESWKIKFFGYEIEDAPDHQE